MELPFGINDRKSIIDLNNENIIIVRIDDSENYFKVDSIDSKNNIVTLFRDGNYYTNFDIGLIRSIIIIVSEEKSLVYSNLLYRYGCYCDLIDEALLDNKSRFQKLSPVPPYLSSYEGGWVAA